MGVDDITTTSDYCKTSLEEGERVRHLLDEHGTADSPRAHELYTCTICAKHFSKRRVLQLHLQTHQINDTIVHQCETKNNQLTSEEPPTTEIQPQNKTNTSREQRLFQWSAAAKRVGLRKIRLEDCFRCDACSCIYLEEEDYRKHMRNFHKDRLQKQKRACKSCCKHCNCTGNHSHLTTEPRTTSSNNLHFNIKDRWKKIVSTRMEPTINTPVPIHTVPDLEDCKDMLDYSHLLSQVEVRIKTEPEDNTTDN